VRLDCSFPIDSLIVYNRSLLLPLNLDVVVVCTLVVLSLDLEDDGGHVSGILQFWLNSLRDQRDNMWEKKEN
jgi:hypothetical protein